MSVTLRKQKSATATNGASQERNRADQQHNDDSSLVQILSQWQAVVEFNLDGTIRTANDNFTRTMG